jgi:glucose-1-phosphate cytidylyltransferase
LCAVFFVLAYSLMKVVLFCGGQGMRLRDMPQPVPKPMTVIGYRPLLWHLMKYYSHYGHHDFVLCLGHGGDVIKEAFLNYNECVSNDFILSSGGKKIELLRQDIGKWRITFVDTGQNSNVGQRLLRVRKFVGDDEVFLANYADGLTDLPLPRLIDYFKTSKKIACFVGVTPTASFHCVSLEPDGVVREIAHIARSGSLINGGFFVFRRELFDYIKDGEDLVEEPFHRLIAEKQLIAYPYGGFWACMDTFKEKQHLDDLHASGHAPWQVWNSA